jgi:hypothetical protein
LPASHIDHQTRYELRGDAGLACVLTYTAASDEPATWKILLPGPGGTTVIGSDQAAELAGAVDAAPPPPASWRQQLDAE